MELNRTAEQWQKCDPKAMAKMSEAAIMYALADARSDVLRMHAEIERLRAGLTLVACEPINAEYIAQNVLDGRPAYHNTMMAPSNVQAQGRCAALSRSVPWSAVLELAAMVCGSRKPKTLGAE